MSRVLGAIRQSKTREQAVSPQAQRAAITLWAEEHGHEVVKITEDLSQSGKLSAFKRPELGPWLTDLERIASWDILVTPKIDRACQNTQDFLRLLDWAKEYRKTVVSLKENLDMTTAQGRQAARDAASRAEWERDMASERRLETLAELNEQGRWTGGLVPYGMRAEEREDGYYLVIDEDGTADIADTMVDMAIAGKNNRMIRDWLNAEGHKNSRGNTWTIERVRLVLHSESMADVLGEEKHAQLRAALRSRSQPRGQWTSGKHYLLRVAYCAKCKIPLYAALRKRSAFKGYYRCLQCGMVRRITPLEDDIETNLRGIWQDRPYQYRTLVPGDDHERDIKRLEAQLDKVRDIEFIDTSELESEIARLKVAPHEPDEIKLITTSQTIAQHWDALPDAAERNRFLRDRNVRYLVSPDGFEPWSLPEEWNPRHIVRAS
jgi:site-specific DNA recombinase